MTNPNTKTVVHTKYYPVVIESESSYAKEDVSDEFYLVIHNEALNTLFAVFVQSIAEKIAKSLESKLPPAAALEITKKKKPSANQVDPEEVRTWLTEEIKNWLNAARQSPKEINANTLTKGFAAEVGKKKKEQKPKLYANTMPIPSTDELLVYPPKEVFNYISDSTGKKKTLSDMIKVLVDERDLYKFLMEIGHMAG